MLYVISTKHIPKKNHAAFMALAEGLIEHTRKEEGCLEYTLTASRTDENVLIYFERWESQAHLDAHANSDFLVALRPQLAALCDSKELMVLENAYELAAEEAQAGK